MKKFISNSLTILSLFVAFTAHAQMKVGDNPTTINPNSVLEIESTNKGLLLPRLGLSSTTSFAPLAAHVAGMTVYNTATAGDVTPGFYYNDGSKWVRLFSSSTALNTTAANNLITITNGTGATLTAMTVGVDTTQLKTFLAGNVSSVVAAPLSGNGTAASPISITTGNLSAGTLLTTTGTPTAALLKTAGYNVDTTALKTFISNAINNGAITGKNTTSTSSLITLTNNTGATLTAMTIGLDTTALKAFLAGKVSVVASSPLTGNGTAASPLGITTNNTTAGQLVTVTNGTGATFTAMTVAVDTTALKTFLANAGFDNTTDRFVENAGNTVVSTGNVGIGTTAPSTKLDVKGADSANSIITVGTTVGTYGSLFLGNSNHGLYRGDYGTTTNLNDVTLYTTSGNLNLSAHKASGPMMTIVGTGHTGIGTESPSNRLHVVNTSNPLRLEGLQAGASADSILTVNATGVVRMRSTSSILSGATTNTLTNTTNTITSTVNGVVATAPAINTNVLSLTSPDTLTSTVNGIVSNKLSLTSAIREPWFKKGAGTGATANTDTVYIMGNVGIGTTSPIAKLHLYMQATDSAVIDHINDFGPNGQIRLQNLGGDGTKVGITYDGQSGGGAAHVFGRNDISGWGTYQAFYTHANPTSNSGGLTEAMRITSEQRVGIGTIAPTNTLHIFATSNPLRLEGLQVGAVSDSILTADATGVVRKVASSSLSTSKKLAVVTTAANSFTIPDTADVVIYNGTANTAFTLPAASAHYGRELRILNYAMSDVNAQITLSTAVISEGATTNVTDTRINSKGSIYEFPAGLGSQEFNTITLISNGTSWYKLGN